jgi:hypothetical protein
MNASPSEVFPNESDPLGSGPFPYEDGRDRVSIEDTMTEAEMDQAAKEQGDFLGA